MGFSLKKFAAPVVSAVKQVAAPVTQVAKVATDPIGKALDTTIKTAGSGFETWAKTQGDVLSAVAGNPALMSAVGAYMGVPPVGMMGGGGLDASTGIPFAPAPVQMASPVQIPLAAPARSPFFASPTPIQAPGPAPVQQVVSGGGMDKKTMIMIGAGGIGLLALLMVLKR